MKSRLKNAIYTLLFDQHRLSSDFAKDSSEEKYIEEIVSVLIAENKDACPFKDYNCPEICSTSSEHCLNGWVISCLRDSRDIWFEFLESGNQN